VLCGIYGSANRDDFLSAYGIAATVVPIGSSQSLEAYPTPLPEAHKDIDVLFIGTDHQQRVFGGRVEPSEGCRHEWTNAKPVVRVIGLCWHQRDVA
jgi:hypothetical protein